MTNTNDIAKTLLDELDIPIDVGRIIGSYAQVNIAAQELAKIGEMIKGHFAY